MYMHLKTMLLVKTANKALQVTQKASFVLCITLRFIFAQNKGHFLGHLNLALAVNKISSSQI